MGIRSGLMCMSNIVLICIGFIMIGTGLYQKKIISPCLPKTGPAFLLLGLILLVIPQLGLYAPCCRSKRLFTTYFYLMLVVILAVGGYSFKCLLYTTTIRIGDPYRDPRAVDQFFGRLVSKEKYQWTKSCIIKTTDCNINGSKNSNVWKYCCVQPEGCEDKQMYGKPGEWSWTTQHQNPNQVPEECAYEYCLDCRGCELSILRTIVHPWRFLSVFTNSAFVISLVAVSMAWSLRRCIYDSDDYRGYYS